jgi:4-hydroxy-3-methylbut-2-enyl diphosphate reductase
MEVTLARKAGFCFGVKRATLMAFEAAKKGKESATFTLGPIIHSPQVVERLREMGVEVLHDLSDLDAGTIIIRSHGVTESELAEALRKELEVVDATCPFVKKAQEFVKSLSDSGYDVVVFGEADHPEVEGLISYAKGRAFVVASAEEAAALPRMNKVGIVAQTTQPVENLKRIVMECLAKGTEVRVYNTICDATSERQEEARSIAAVVDCMIVIGGYSSGNTRRLAEICAAIQPRTHHIETADQLREEWFAGAGKVGVTAGASTPKWLIDEVLSRIDRFDRDKKD